MIDANIEHLLPWMPWAAHEPEPLAEKALRLRELQGHVRAGDEDNIYGIFDAADREVLGGTGLHPRSGAEAREIGYWISAEHEGKGLISESSAALTRVGFELLGLDRIEIHCDPRNVRSAAVPERLGFEHEATLRRRLAEADGTLRDVMIWTLFADEYERFTGSGSADPGLRRGGRAAALRPVNNRCLALVIHGPGRRSCAPGRGASAWFRRRRRSRPALRRVRSTRWHGTMIGIGFFAIALPAARAACGLPAASASSE